MLPSAVGSPNTQANLYPESAASSAIEHLLRIVHNLGYRGTNPVVCLDAWTPLLREIFTKSNMSIIPTSPFPTLSSLSPALLYYPSSSGPALSSLLLGPSGPVAALWAFPSL